MRTGITAARVAGRWAARRASMSRYCELWKASNGRWYMDLASREYGEYDDATTYGPFSSEEAAERHLRNFSNPGGLDVDDSGDRPPPTRSPNGSPVNRPSSSGSSPFVWSGLGPSPYRSAGEINVLMTRAVKPLVDSARGILSEITGLVTAFDPDARTSWGAEILVDDPKDGDVTVAWLDGQSGRHTFGARVLRSGRAWQVMTLADGFQDWAGSAKDAADNIVKQLSR